jgi:hypothetical protein
MRSCGYFLFAFAFGFVMGQTAHADQSGSGGPIPDLGSMPQITISSSSLPTQSNVPAAGKGNPLWAIPLTSLNATRERPIFSRSRRPPVSAQTAPVRSDPPPPVAQQPTRPLLTLLGAIAGDADGIAILLDESTKSVVRMKTGEKRSGWVLRSVEKRSATFEMARQVAVLVIPVP